MRREWSLIFALMIWCDRRGIFLEEWWGLVPINTIECIQLNEREIFLKLWDFWLLISLELVFEAKPIRLTRSKQVQKPTHRLHDVSQIPAWPWDFGTARAREWYVGRGLANLMSPWAQNKQAVSSVLPAPCHSADSVGSGDRHPACSEMTLLLIDAVV